MKTLPVAVQVYSVRDDAERDFKGTMQKIKDMGYDGVELAGLYGMKPAEVAARSKLKRWVWIILSRSTSA